MYILRKHLSCGPNDVTSAKVSFIVSFYLPLIWILKQVKMATLKRRKCHWNIDFDAVFASNSDKLHLWNKFGWTASTLFRKGVHLYERYYQNKHVNNIFLMYVYCKNINNLSLKTKFFTIEKWIGLPLSNPSTNEWKI